MRPSFTTHLNRKIEQMEEAWKSLQQEWSSPVLGDLYRWSDHLFLLKGTETLNPVSEFAFNLKLLLKPYIDKPVLPGAAERDAITDQLAELKQAIQSQTGEKPSVHAARVLQLPKVRVDFKPELPAEASEPLVEGAEPNRLLALLDSDPAQARELATQLQFYGYTVEIFYRYSDLKEYVAFNVPGVILLEIPLHQNIPTVFSSLKNSAGKRIPLVFISERSDMFARLQAVKAGGDAYFTRPLAIQELIDQLDAMTAPPVPVAYRILIVDDSPTAVAFYTGVLQRAGMLTTVVTNPMQIMQPLIEFGPDLILMDMYMPGCNGLELAAVIRQQSGYVSVPIVFLSSETNLTKQMLAMHLGGDDFLTKPIQAEHLVSAITARAQRSRILRSYIERDSLTGLFNHNRSIEQLTLEINRAVRQAQPLTFAILDIDHFKQVNDNYGHSTGDRVIKNLSRMLQQRLRRTDIIGRYGGEEFVVILPDTSVENSMAVLDDLRVRFAQVDQFAMGEAFNCTFSVGLAGYPEYSDPSLLCQAADQALYRAKRRGRNRVEIAL
ncbi:MAG TPA: diguanylate cyclase [Chloroflexia bacterium]|nr:diguanylate cyclase [Chloroflexia bacterium]